MTRPRNESIVITAERQMERLQENYTRRQLMQLFGATGAAALAGCGGGGGTDEESPTATEAGGDQQTPEPTATPASDVEVTDHWLHDVTETNFEQLQPNVWNAESGTNPVYQELALAGTSPTIPVGPGEAGAEEMIMLEAAKRIEIDSSSNQMTVELRDDLEWGDGSTFDVETVQMHIDILRSQIELGEQVETALPLSTETPDSYTMEMTLLPGDAIIRMWQALWSSPFTAVSNTHPELHREFVEGLRDATTQSAIQSQLQELFSARFDQSDIPKMALGPFKATDWDPSQMTFEARKNWPWGLDYHPDQDRIFRGVRWRSIGEQTNVVNAAVTGNKDWILLPSLDVFDRFDESKWRTFHETENAAITLYFGRQSRWANKTERARKMRQAVAYLMDAEEFAAVNQLIPAYEQTAAFAAEENFKNWIGNRFFFENYTNYGHQERQYVYEQKGNQKFRDANFEKNKDGFWVDQQSGEVLTANGHIATQPDDGMIRPVIENGVEQLNRIGVKTNASIVEETDDFQNRVLNFDFDVSLLNSQSEVFPHPWHAYSQCTGLGSLEGMPVGINSWDWRNGYRRVEVPMPVGDPDGDLQTYDFDKRTMEMVEIDSQEKMQERVHELSWVLNQWVPGVILVATSVRGAVRSPDRISITDDWQPYFFGEFGKPAFNFGGGFFQPPA